MRLGVLFVLGLGCLAGTVTDMLASVFGLIAIMDVDEPIARVLVGGFGFVVTMFVAGTKYAIAPKTPPIVAVVWALCMIVDIATTVVGLVHFIINKGGLNTPVVSDWNTFVLNVGERPLESSFAAVMLLVVTSATIAGPYCLEAINEDLPKP